MTDNAHSSGKAADNFRAMNLCVPPPNGLKAGEIQPYRNWISHIRQRSRHPILRRLSPHQSAQKKYEIRGFTPLAEMIINRPGRWIISGQHFPLTAGVNKICNGCEYPVEVCPLLSVKARQELADSISLSAFKLYFHGLNNLRY